MIDIRVHMPGVDTNEVSDGYHTFGELYEHRIELFLALCRYAYELHPSGTWWRSLKHSDGSTIKGWFIVGIFKEIERQITYHLPLSRWSDCEWAETLDKAPEFDGHSPADVLARLKAL